MRKGKLWKLVAGGSAIGIGAAAGMATAGTNAPPRPVELGDTGGATTLDIEAMGGRIHVSSRAGVGTVFTVDLPVVPAPAAET